MLIKSIAALFLALSVVAADAASTDIALGHTIAGMNHVLKLAQGDMQAQMKAYTTPDLPVAPKLVTAIVEFIGKR